MFDLLFEKQKHFSEYKFSRNNF